MAAPTPHPADPEADAQPTGAPDLSLRRFPAALPDLPTEPLRSVDYAWLRMDEPANLMIINGVLVFDQPSDAGRVRDVVRDRLLSIDRFRQRVVRSKQGLWPAWQVAPDFDLDHHLVEVTLPEPGDDAALSDFIGARMGEQLDPARPPWVFYLIHNYQGGSALLGRLHHCLGDGIALMLVLLSMTDLEAEGEPVSPHDEGANPFRLLFAKAREDLEAVRSATERLMPEGMKLLLKPAQALREAGKLLTGVAATDALGRLLLRSRDPRTRFKGPLGIPKTAAWSDALLLADVRTLAQGLGGSVNDVLSSAAAGALRRYLLEHGEPPADLSFRAAVPVNLRPLDEMAQLGNRFGLVFLSLPVGIRDPVERIAELRRRMYALKRSAEPMVTYGILRAMGRSPMLVQKAVVKLIAAKTTAVLTSVPGPQKPLYLGGRHIRDVFFWVPQAGRVGLGLSICSYAGQVRFGVTTDAGLIPDPGRIIEGFHHELDEMRQRSS
jgi:WS/DGAT/MGAT family acyltransferase